MASTTKKIKLNNMKRYDYTPDIINTLADNEIFVFGSNLQGMHSGGAARTALLHFGAVWGEGVGLYGQSYAIPTMHGGVEAIKPYVDEFIDFAKTNSHLTFLVTPIGCGIAGFTAEQMAPLFSRALGVENIVLPQKFVKVLQQSAEQPRRVFVTGAAHGIGRAIVETFVTAGDLVAFCDIDSKLGGEVAATTGARFFNLDVCDKAALESAMQTLLNEWGDLDIIVNNVGIGGFEPITESSIENFERVINTNLRSTFITSRLLAIHREKMGATNTYGRIVNLCSTRYLQSETGTEAYAASKGGIWSLTHALAVSLAQYNITVNCIAPGWISVNEGEILRTEDHAFHLSGRVGKAEDIANTCLFLCNKKSDFINGQCITVDGGVTKKMIYPEE